jgi:hypothetical protein
VGHSRLDLPGGSCAIFFRELSDDFLKVGITRAKAAREPVSAAFGDSFAVCEYVKLADLARRTNSIDAQALLDQGHETRDLGAVVLSGRTVNDFDLHGVLPSRNIGAGGRFVSSNGDVSSTDASRCSRALPVRIGLIKWMVHTFCSSLSFLALRNMGALARVMEQSR